MLHEHFNTLPQLLATRADQQPFQNAFTILLDGEEESVSITYADLDRRARIIGHSLKSLRAEDHRALLLYPPGLEFIIGFWGCLYAGIVAVPAYPLRLNHSFERLRTIIKDSKATIGLTEVRSLSKMRPLFSHSPDLDRLQWFTTDDIEGSIAQEVPQTDVTADTLALLQYTSGSISKPKGVMITHGNLLHNQRMIKEVFQQSQNSIIVSWLPFYHDMGLIGNVVQPVYLGAHCIFMPPMAFLQRPYRWLQAISRYKATTSGSPNFGYDLCARKITAEQRRNLDLSNWSVAYNGSEPVRPDTLQLFYQTFKSCGFRRSAFHPCYGLAEATLLVSAAKFDLPVIKTFQTAALNRNRVIEVNQNEGETDCDGGMALVSCGRALADVKIVIAHPDSLAKCLSDEIGEIWVSSQSIAQGYFNLPFETAETFNARLSDTGEGPFLRTGDLGFVRDGELFITGRVKDLIIIRGLNYYPQDIELIVERCHSFCRAHSGAAFAIEVGGETRVVVLQEVDSQSQSILDALIDNIRCEIASHFDLQVHSVALVKAGQLSRTSNGKIRRSACRDAYLEGKLSILACDTLRHPETENEGGGLDYEAALTAEHGDRKSAVETYLLNLISRMLGVPMDHSNLRRPFIALGLDSLTAAELKNRIELDLNVIIPMADILQLGDIGSLAEQLSGQLSTPPSSPSETYFAKRRVTQVSSITPMSVVNRSKDLPLSSDQERLWLLDQLSPGGHAYNITVTLCLSGALNVSALKQSFDCVIRRHDILRAVFYISNGALALEMCPKLTLELPVIDLNALPESQRESRVRKCVMEMAQLPFDLARGPLLRAVLLRLGGRKQVLTLNIHHIIFDYQSMFVLIKEIATNYDALSIGKAPSLADLPIQYADYVRWQRMQKETWEPHLTYWRSQLADAPSPFSTLPSARTEPASFNKYNRSDQLFFTLPVSLSKAVKEMSRNEGVTLFMTLLASFNALLYYYLGNDDILVGAPTTGRFQTEVENLIGLFAYPLALRTNLSGDPTFHELITRVREVVLGAYSHQETPFAKVVEVAQPERVNSYNPLFQTMFSFVKAPISAIEVSDLRISLIDVRSGSMNLHFFLTIVSEGEFLRGSLAYDTNYLNIETAERLVNSYMRVLEESVRNPEIKLSQFEMGDKLESGPNSISKQNRRQAIAITSTFTAKPLEESLLFWMQELGLNVDIKFAAYGRTFQELLDPSSLLSRNHDGLNVILIRFRDWQTKRGVAGADSAFEEEEGIEEAVRDFISALKVAAERSTVPHLICMCNAPEDAVAEKDLITSFNYKCMEEIVVSELEGINNVYVATLSEVLSIYPVSKCYDPASDELAHIPFTTPFFTSLGTIIARKYCALNTIPYKVIVLDCDQTLWKGYCGEDGFAGVEVDPARKSLQEFMLGQYNAGMLICLCSKNNEEDVIDTFRSCSEMVIKLDHLTSWRINWMPKSENLRSLAEELQLGLDSFIFVDDDPIECAEVQANCPEVLTFQLPPNSEDIRRFLNHIWAFDHLNVTAEGKERTTFYKEKVLRQQLREAVPTLSEFLLKLRIEVKISTIEPRHFTRVSELTYRTNQFNFTSVRRSESEVRRIYQSKELECLVVNVADRFGDYGLVGLMYFGVANEAVEVDNFILSCRALSKGVEYQMLARLGEITQERGLNSINIYFTPTKKNLPAEDYLNSICSQFTELNEGCRVYKFPAERGSQIYARYIEELTGSEISRSDLSTSAYRNTPSAVEVRMDPSSVHRIANEHYNAERITDAIRLRRKEQLNQSGQLFEGKGAGRPAWRLPLTHPRTPIEKALVECLSDILGHAQVGVSDNFFELGGHSLQAIQLISRIREAFDVQLLLPNIFEAPTVEGLAMLIEEALIKGAQSEEIDVMINELNALSDEEVERLLASESNY